jgi:hypothetical protein
MKTPTENLPPENSVEASPGRLATAACYVWKPIDADAKKGTVLLGRAGREPIMDFWLEYGNWCRWRHSDSSGCGNFPPTHYMPIKELL